MWLDTIFLRVYCMRYSTALFLLLAATVLFLVLKQTVQTGRLFRVIVVLALLFWSLAVGWNTLAGRESVLDNSSSSLIPFHSYYVVFTGGERELLRCNFMNVVLFYPAGLLACELLPKRWSRTKRVILVTVLFALGQAEIDDVIHNTLGALIGALVCTINLKWKPYKSKD